MAIVKEAVWNISSLSIPSNWWSGFSSWEDFLGLLRSGKNLPIHTIAMDVNRRLETIESGYCLIDYVSEKGDISIDLHGNFPTLIKKGYQITAKKTRLRILKQISAYNVAKCISSKSDVQYLQIPKSFYN